MCNRKQFKVEIDEAAKRFNVQIEQSALPQMEEDFGFDHNPSPIIKVDSPDILTTDYRWGLIPPTWKKEPKDIWNGTLNAKLEEADTKYSFRDVIHQRCLIPASAYYEYHWNDAKGKSKTKYIIHHDSVEVFAFAGFYSEWTSRDGELFKTYTIATTEANDTMRYIHNKDAGENYFRMPVLLNPEDERSWLDLKNDIQDFNYPNYKPRLVAFPYEGQMGMF